MDGVWCFESFGKRRIGSGFGIRVGDGNISDRSSDYGTDLNRPAVISEEKLFQASRFLTDQGFPRFSRSLSLM